MVLTKNTMKKISILCALAITTSIAFSQTLFTYGNAETSKAEFLRAYNKNKPNTTDKAKALREYLDLYSNFKLKVRAAQDLRIDTLPQINYDVQNFRDQVVENYMNDDKGLQLLIDEATARATKDILLNYFFVPVGADANPTDSLKAYTAINELYKTLKNGKTNYKEIATENNTKFAPTKFADAGFVTVFSLPYDLENVLYNTKTGTFSNPFRNNKGWFIFKPVEERKAIGKWKVAQLLFAFPPDASTATKQTIKLKADSVRNLLDKGMSFAEAATKFSDDRVTSANGGILQEFGAGAFNAIFENNVIALKNDNDLTAPFETSFGYHIVKRISAKPIPTDKTDASFQYEIKQNVSQDARVTNVKDNFIKSITAKTGFKREVNIKDATFFKVADSTIKNNASGNNKEIVAFALKPIVRFADGSIIKGNEWISFVKNSTQNGDIVPVVNNTLLDNFFKQTVSIYYKKNVEKYNAEFKYQMQEFKEGNMLFEIMERNVWSKAGVDSMKLVKYYDTHKQNYKWTASADVIIFNSSDEKKINVAYEEFKKGTSWKTIIEKSEGQIQADSGRYELAQIPGFVENTKPIANTIAPIVVNKTDASASFVKFVKLYDAGTQRTYNEARGLVINDYQIVLEQEWLESLKKKYPIKINEAVFKEMLK
jgi:peptidyl-prolyl cis-trans isomerase SurA